MATGSSSSPADHHFFNIHAQAVLATRHGQIDVGQQLRVQQRAVQLAVGVGNAVAVAQRIQRVALARMQPWPAPAYRSRRMCW
jgi:hypothetical protein